MDLVFNPEKTGTLVSGAGTELFRTPGLLYAPIFFLVILCCCCLPVWIIFNCCEDCWYKKRKVYKNFVPWLVFGIWALLFLVYIIASTSTFINFTKMTSGMIQTVCDIGGSVLKIGEWFQGIIDIALKLGTQLSDTVSESNVTIFRTLDKLEADVNGLKNDVDAVVVTITAASATISATLRDANLADQDVNLPATDLQQVVKEAFGDGGIKSVITQARASVASVMDSVENTVQTFPKLLNSTMAPALQSLLTFHNDAFGDGAGIAISIPALIPESKLNLQQVVLKVMNAIMTVVNLITIPVMAFFPFLLAGGIVIVVAFKFCFASERWACCGRCLSKSGGVMLWLGVVLALVFNVVFVVLHVMYDDMCVVATEPNALIAYARDAYPDELAKMFPAPQDTRCVSAMQAASWTQLAGVA